MVTLVEPAVPTLPYKKILLLLVAASVMLLPVTGPVIRNCPVELIVTVPPDAATKLVAPVLVKVTVLPAGFATLPGFEAILSVAELRVPDDWVMLPLPVVAKKSAANVTCE